MRALVVYESLWGNTAAIAGAVAEGIGPEAVALPTGAATIEVVADVDLLVAGAPVMQFRLPSDKTRESLGPYVAKAPALPDLSNPSMRSWLAALGGGRGRSSAAFETRLWWSPRGATSAIENGLEKAGYRVAARRERFVVEGTYGPLREGELERARQWGEELANRLLRD